jgi:hypothetical protein
MCSHEDCWVEVLPDGQIDETHVTSLDELVELKVLQKKLNEVIENMSLASRGYGIPYHFTTNAGEVPNG